MPCYGTRLATTVTVQAAIRIGLVLVLAIGATVAVNYLLLNVAAPSERVGNLNPATTSELTTVPTPTAPTTTAPTPPAPADGSRDHGRGRDD